MPAKPPDLSVETIMTLRELRRAGGQTGRRATIILLAHKGWTDVAIAAELGIARQTAARWRGRFSTDSEPARLGDAPRTGRPPVREVPLLLATAQPQPDGEAWSASAVAARLGLSAATVRRVWRRWGVTRNGRVIIQGPSTGSGRVRSVSAVRSESRVLSGEVDGFGGLYLNSGDAAFAYWIRDDTSALPTPEDPRPFQSLLGKLRTPIPRDECFPEQRDLEFEEFLDHLAERAGGSVLRVVIARPEMIDSDVIMPWTGRQDIDLGPPWPSISWATQLEAVIAGILGSTAGLDLAAKITRRIEELRQTGADDHEPIRWYAAM